MEQKTLIRSGAANHRGSSKQDYATPREFLAVVEQCFGPIRFDLAASAENAVVSSYFTEADDALTREWPIHSGNLWLNPPFGNIAPWAARCAHYRRQGAHILFLVPASVGSEWYAHHVHPHAMAYALRPRLSFDGKNPFPKDCVLAHYAPDELGFDLWRWK